MDKQIYCLKMKRFEVLLPWHTPVSDHSVIGSRVSSNILDVSSDNDLKKENILMHKEWNLSRNTQQQVNDIYLTC